MKGKPLVQAMTNEKFQMENGKWVAPYLQVWVIPTKGRPRSAAPTAIGPSSLFSFEDDVKYSGLEASPVQGVLFRRDGVFRSIHGI